MKLSARTIAGVTAAIFAALTFFFWPKAKVSEEDQIRALIAGCVKAAEDKDLAPIADAMADDFRGPNNAHKEDVKMIIGYQVLRNRETVAVFNPKLSVTVTGPDTAETSGKFIFARVKAKSADDVPADGVISSYEIEGELKKKDGKWKFTTARYTQGL